MARSGPSIIALLGLLAVAGYQNRDKLSDLARRVQDKSANPRINGDFASQVQDMFSGLPAAGTLTAALSELVSMFKGTPQQDDVQSWVSQGQNRHLGPDDLASVIGEDTLRDLAEKTGMDRKELLAALSRQLPVAVDGMTPNGRLPSDDEARGFI